MKKALSSVFKGKTNNNITNNSIIKNNFDHPGDGETLFLSLFLSKQSLFGFTSTILLEFIYNLIVWFTSILYLSKKWVNAFQQSNYLFESS